MTYRPVRIRTLLAFGTALAVTIGLPLSCGSASVSVMTPPQADASLDNTTTTTRCDLTPNWSWTATALGDHVNVTSTPAGAEIELLPNPRMLASQPPVPVPLVLGVVRRSEDCQWAEVLLPHRPNGSTGWIPVSQVNLKMDPYSIEVSLSDRHLTVAKADDRGATAVIRKYPIAVGAPSSPTPTGLAAIIEVVAPAAGSPYGPLAMGLSLFSEALATFNGAPAQIALHGTNDPSSIGRNVSNGCIRLFNDDIRDVGQLVPVGTLVRIQD